MALEVSLDETRYDRQERITWWDQDLLARSRVLVVGAGALGNEVVKNLALVGVGSIVVVDFDHVEMSNLSRCVFFRDEDEGRPKAAALAERARDLNPTIDVVGLDADARSFGTGIALRADVMVGALDSREARRYVNRLAWRVGRPWVDGAIEALAGLARVFRPPDSCYECTLTDADFEALSYRQSCRLLSVDDLAEGKVPTTATMSSMVAGLESQEVVKLLHRHLEGVRPLSGAMVFDGANNDAYPITYPSREDCLAHHRYESPDEMVWSPELTFDEIAGAVGMEAAVVELGDDHLMGWRCTECDEDEAAGGIVDLVGFEEAECPSCGEARQPQTTTAVEVGGGDDPVTIGDLHVRPDEILPVRHGMDYRYVWLQQPPAGFPDDWS